MVSIVNQSGLKCLLLVDKEGDFPYSQVHRHIDFVVWFKTLKARTFANRIDVAIAAISNSFLVSLAQIVQGGTWHYTNHNEANNGAKFDVECG